MLSFRHYITELFNEPFPLLSKHSGGRGETYVYGDGKSKNRIVILFSPIYGDDWDLLFTRGGELKMTNAGDAGRVFATVMDGIEKFIKEKNPKTVYFTAEKSEEGKKTGRASLYKAMIKRLAKPLGYEIDDSVEHLGYQDNEQFTLKRIRK